MKPWHIGSHLIELNKSFQMNTNIAGLRYILDIFVVHDRNKRIAVE